MNETPQNQQDDQEQLSSTTGADTNYDTASESNDETEPRESSISYVHTTNLPDILSSAQISVVVSTYQIGKLLAFSSVQDRCSLLMRSFPHPMGIAFHGDKLALLCKNQIWHLVNRPDLYDRAGQRVAYDKFYIPRWSHVTGDIAGHEIAWGYNPQNNNPEDEPELWVVNTRFSCIATLDKECSFIPRWKPPFITEIAPQDRCHLNGMAMLYNHNNNGAGTSPTPSPTPSPGSSPRPGLPKYVTSLGTANTPQGWRDNKLLGGCMMDVETNEIIASKLCMPHSPRLYANKLWFLESGTGEFKTLDIKNGKTETIIRLPGFLRGLTFYGNLAFIGLSQIRESNAFSGIPILDHYKKLECGVSVVDINTGKLVAKIEFQSACSELFDVQIATGTNRLGIVGFAKDTIDGIFVLPEADKSK